jgi:copper chaperone CopZ
MITSISIGGMSKGHTAVEQIRAALERLPIRRCHVVVGRATVEYDDASVGLATLEDAIASVGYRVESWCSVPPSFSMDEYVLNPNSIPPRF